MCRGGAQESELVSALEVFFVIFSIPRTLNRALKVINHILKCPVD